MAAMDAENQAFFKAVNEASEEQKSRLIADIDRYKQQQLAQAEADAEKAYNDMIKSANEKLISEDSKETADSIAQMRKSVSDTRAEITEKVFSEVKNKLSALTTSSEYEGVLIADAEKMVKICKDAPLTVYVRECDMKFADSIKKVSNSINIEIDNSISIGGIYGICDEKSIHLNDTLDIRLESQKDWFYDNSGLTL